jgi:DNA mismatch endonuclease, patch repair protein
MTSSCFVASDYRKRVEAKPPASSALIRDRMQAQRTRDTDAERSLRSALHRRGYRFRINQKLPLLPRKTIDVVFLTARVAILVDGCFWHGCPLHATWPKANAEWWRKKLDDNRRRDESTNRALVEGGWNVVRVWEHVDAELAAARIAELLASPPTPPRVTVIL